MKKRKKDYERKIMEISYMLHGSSSFTCYVAGTAGSGGIKDQRR